MKPDGVTTSPAEPAEDMVEPVAEAAATEELVQEDLSPLCPQLENPENKVKQEEATSTLPPPVKEVNGKNSQPKDKPKAPVKTKPGTAGVKATTTVGASRLASAESRVANGVKKTASIGTSKKPASLTSEIKKSAPVGSYTQAKKVPTATTVTSRTQVRAAEPKTRPVASTSNVTRKTAPATSQALSNRPVAGGSNAAVKPKTTAPRTTTAPAAKTSVPDGSKAASIPKSSRPTVATASRPATSSAPVKLTSTTSKSTALKTTVSSPSGAKTSSQPFKVSSTVAAKKDVGTTASAAARKALASTTTRSTAPKAFKPDPPKLSAAAKRLPTDIKTSQQKMITSQLSMRKGPSSTRNIPAQTASGRMAAEISNHKQGVSSNLAAVKVQTAKPTQSVMPLVIKGKPLEEPSSAHMEPSAIIETTAAIEPVESVLETQVLVQGQEEGVHVFSSESANEDTITNREATDAEALAIQPVSNVPGTSNPAVEPEYEKVHDHVLVMAPIAQEMIKQEDVTASPCEVPVTAQITHKDSEVAEKQGQIICNFEEEEEEEKEGSQQVSVSDMSGTQPTEESRPGSAGLVGSLWKAGGLPSEFDSEDVSCSQHGASELSAPGVLEGTESMDDLGEASLKGADEGASAGSPDFEKFPDIPGNEDDDEEDEDDDEDRVDDMEVGSEMTEDPQRQCNDNEDEDDDVEMASEGVTESGLESYGNADEDDLAEDYRLDNLNRLQPFPIVPALSSADAWMQSLQPDGTPISGLSSNPWQTCSELNAAAEAGSIIEGAKAAPSSQVSAVLDPSLTPPSLEPAGEMGMDCKHEPASHSQCISQSCTLLGPELADDTPSGASTPEELKDHSTQDPVAEHQKQLMPISPVPVALPDIMQDLEKCTSDHTESKQPVNRLPAGVMLADLSTLVTSAPSGHLPATGDEAYDSEGHLQPSNPTEPGSIQNECLNNTEVAQSMSTGVEDGEEVCVEIDGDGGSDTPQSATSAASYGFEGTASNSNAQSTTESCIKSPGIFSLENEEQLSYENKDLLIKELSHVPVDSDRLDQQGECLLNSEQQYMHCGKVAEETPDTVPAETCLDSPCASEHQQDLDLDAPHSYYSTVCEKTDSFLTGGDLYVPQQENVPAFTRQPKHHSEVRVDHVTRLPTDLPPRMPSAGCNAQLRRLEQHQQQLAEMEQRREKQSRITERPMEEKEVTKCNERNAGREEERESKQMRREKERELEEQKRHLLHLQIQQQQQELKQRQQIMQWQQELEQQTQQGKHQNNHRKNSSTVLLSPSGLCTIYEGLESSDAEEDQMEEKEMVLELKIEHECSSEERSSISPADTGSDSLQSQDPTPFTNFIDHHEPVTCSPLGGSSSGQPQSPLEFEWGQKTDIVQQLINQTLLLNGDKCSQLLLLPGGAAGTLSPLETSLWPNLPQMTPLPATVTAVSSYSAELAGSSPQGEWTVVELETHH